MVKYLKNLSDSLYLNGVSLKRQERVYREIEEANRKSIVAYAGICMAAFIAMTIFAIFIKSDVSRNRLLYAVGALVMAALFGLNLTVAKKYKQIIQPSAYLFVAAILMVGIMLAIAGKDDVTASYMVFLFVAPLLFILKPLYVIVMIVGSDLFYVFCMHKMETSVLFGKNIVNAVIYGVLSVFISTTMIRMRIQKFETDDMNRVLMESDQLTGMLNRRSYERDIEQLKENGGTEQIKMCVFDVNGLKIVNDTIGHTAGDELLRAAAACIETVFAQYGRCYRMGGDEFVAILLNADISGQELETRLKKETEGYLIAGVSKLSISVGIVDGTEEDSITDLLKRADTKMYDNKAEYYRSRASH